MKYYILEAADGFTDTLKADVQKILDQRNGKILSFRPNGFLMLISATEDLFLQIKALQGISFAAENQWTSVAERSRTTTIGQGCSKKQYIVSSDSGIDKDLRTAIEKVLGTTGGRIVDGRDGGYMALVEAPKEAVPLLKQLKGVDAIDENKINIARTPMKKRPGFGL